MAIVRDVPPNVRNFAAKSPDRTRFCVRCSSAERGHRTRFCVQGKYLFTSRTMMGHRCYGHTEG